MTNNGTKREMVNSILISCIKMLILPIRRLVYICISALLKTCSRTYVYKLDRDWLSSPVHFHIHWIIYTIYSYIKSDCNLEIQHHGEHSQNFIFYQKVLFFSESNLMLSPIGKIKMIPDSQQLNFNFAMNKCS